MFSQLKAMALLLLISFGLAGCSSTDIDLSSPDNSLTLLMDAEPSVNIYMLRGGFNGVFSTGVTDMAAELRSRGVPAQDRNWGEKKILLAEIRKSISSNPNDALIILVGHSLGATSALEMMRELANENVEIDLVVVFDALGSPRVPKQVKRLVNFKATGKKSDPGHFSGEPGFTGKIINVDIRNLEELEKANHWNIVNLAELQRRGIEEIENAYRRHLKSR